MAFGQPLVWPPAPDTARIEYLGELPCDQLKPKTGFLGKLLRTIGGGSKDEQLSLPFDLEISDNTMFLVCQNFAALIEVDLIESNFKLHRCKDRPFIYPVTLCDGGNGRIFITDPESKAVYQYFDDKVSLFIGKGLIRPTGVTALPEKGRIYIVDTGDHSLKLYDYDGQLIRVIDNDSDTLLSLNYPTFATVTANNQVLVNDALNYKIRVFDSDGQLISSFGEEGDGPGSFARPKGIAVDSDGHVYVVDNIFDNIQIFDAQGRLLLVIGTTGQEIGQFWSPAGIDIANNIIYIADTFNNRIQMFRYLGIR
jgi:hypothetical protein